jgi:hypothetical protein
VRKPTQAFLTMLMISNLPIQSAHSSLHLPSADARGRPPGHVMLVSRG